VDQHQRVIQVALQLLDEFPDLLGAGSEAVEDELRSIIAKAIAEPSQESISALVKYARAQPALAERFNELIGGNWRGGDQAGSEVVRCVPVKVLYGTDRAPTGNLDPTRWFSGEKYLDTKEALSLGRCVVTIPVKHKKGQLESPGLLSVFNRGDESRYVLLKTLEPLDKAGFDAATREQFQAAPRGLLFVHGYNVSFTDAVRRAAQLAHDLEFTNIGPTFCFSWPSKAEFSAYGADAESAKWAVQHLVAFITHLRTATPTLRLHVVAHSMGNRVVTDALKWLHLARDAPAENMSDIALAAPDVDHDVFTSLAESLTESAKRVTLYASSGDRALWLSKLMHKGPRAGDTGKQMLTLDGIDSIDASNADSSLLSLGHSYFAGKPTVLKDIKQLFLEGLGPMERGLKRHPSAASWVM
jgi:esterase/lipase superfamily enzyme